MGDPEQPGADLDDEIALFPRAIEINAREINIANQRSDPRRQVLACDVSRSVVYFTSKVVHEPAPTTVAHAGKERSTDSVAWTASRSAEHSTPRDRVEVSPTLVLEVLAANPANDLNERIARCAGNALTWRDIRTF